MGICHSYTPDGRCVSLLKILLTNLSANVELATEADLRRLAPEKSHADVTRAMRTIAAGIEEARADRPPRLCATETARVW